MSAAQRARAGSTPQVGRPRFALWHGRDEPPARRPLLHAGPVSAILDGADLRHVRLGDVELAERIYVAVRDALWNTIPAELTKRVLELDADHFRVTFGASHRHEDIAFHWRGSIEGRSDGSIRYEMDGACRGVFMYSKIGFNVHHAQADSVGRPYRALTPSGESRGKLPEAITPQRVVEGTLSGMFEPYSELAIEVRPDLEAVIGLEGDLLELQDHRNWTDSNFKSYSTPLALGFPFESRAGQRIRQVLSVGFRGSVLPAVSHVDPVVTFGSAMASGGPLPALGLGLASHGRSLSAREVALLRTLGPAHIRVDLRPAEGTAAEDLTRAALESRHLGCGLELALHTSEGQAASLAELASRLRELDARVDRVLVYAATDGFSAVVATTPPTIVALVRRHLEPIVGDVVFAGGTDQSFADINRDPPSDPVLTGVCFSISPTVHAADDLSLVENLVSQADVVRTARLVAGGRDVCVSPVTLATRFGPYPAGPTREGDLPPPVDPRQASLLGAAWTVGSIAALASAGASSVTYYETTGWRGVMETELGSPMPGRFPSRPGQVFPLYHVLADVSEWRQASVMPVELGDRLRCVAVAVQDAAGVHALVANVTPEAQRVLIAGLPVETVRLRVLDEASAEHALDDPDSFRASSGCQVAARGGRLWLSLGPFATARLDVPV